MPERRRRNVRPEIAAARARLGSLTYRGASPEAIAAARADLEAAKARAVVRGLLPLPAAQRMELAALLLNGAGDAAA
jgi:hypothetical protein